MIYDYTLMIMHGYYRNSQGTYSLVHIQILTTPQKSEAGLNWNVVENTLQSWKSLVDSYLLA